LPSFSANFDDDDRSGAVFETRARLAVPGVCAILAGQRRRAIDLGQARRQGDISASCESDRRLNLKCRERSAAALTLDDVRGIGGTACAAIFPDRNIAGLAEPHRSGGRESVSSRRSPPCTRSLETISAAMHYARPLSVRLPLCDTTGNNYANG
jgi:hypothetical protein